MRVKMTKRIEQLRNRIEYNSKRLRDEFGPLDEEQRYDVEMELEEDVFELSQLSDPRNSFRLNGR